MNGPDGSRLSTLATCEVVIFTKAFYTLGCGFLFNLTLPYGMFYCMYSPTQAAKHIKGQSVLLSLYTKFD